MTKLAIYGLSGNPPANHHLVIIEKLIDNFDSVIVVASGARAQKPSTIPVPPFHKKAMIRLALEDVPNIEIDFYDLNNETFTPHWLLDRRYKEKYPSAERWFVIGGDIISGGKDGKSEIQRIWQKGPEIWSSLNYAVIDHPGCPVDSSDLPPNSMVVKMEKLRGRSKLIREKIMAGLPIDGLVPDKVADYIKENDPYPKN